VKYVDSKWQSVVDEDAYKLTKLEGQVTVLSAESSYVQKYTSCLFEMKTNQL